MTESLKCLVLRDRLQDVRSAMAEPEDVRRSVSDSSVLLFHRGKGYLLTAYPADKLKAGEVVWTR